MCLNRPLMATDHKRVRKLLEMCKSGICLLSDSRYVWGIGTFDPSRYDPSKYDVLEIKFVGHYHWEMWHLQQHLMTVKNGDPRLPLPRIDGSAVAATIRNSFPGIEDTSVAKLADIVVAASNQSHGTTIIISSAAESESERLSGKAGIRPFIPDHGTIAAATSIDGALWWVSMEPVMGSG